MKSVVGLALAAATLFVSRPSEACTPVYNDDVGRDPAYADDATPPRAPDVVILSVERREARGGDGASCGNLSVSRIDLGVSADDDRAPADELGYAVTILTPDSPLRGFGNRIVRADAGVLHMNFDFDADPFDIELEVRAVDLNGNVGEPTTFSAHIEPPEVDGGCSAGGASPGWLGLAALALLRRRRR